MALSSWLTSVRVLCSGRAGLDRRHGFVKPACAVEEFEPRVLLSVSALFVSGTLDVSADAADTIIVRANAGGQVEVLDQNGLLPLGPVGDGSSGAGVLVTGSGSANGVDLSGGKTGQVHSSTQH